MGLVEIASGKSIWRAIDYCNNNKVISWEKSDNGYKGVVSGSENNVYDVIVDLLHPRKSVCTCPFATDHRVICKHMLAVYFTANPSEIEKIEKEAEEYEREEENRQQEYENELRKYVNMLSKEELREELLEALVELDYYRARY